MSRLAHISDIHFGSTFDFDVWDRVKAEIKAAAPSIIIASGDFIDSPDPLLLLAAKFELQDLSAACGPNTEFFVVPGNHDLLDLGNIWHPGAAWWFERVMFNDTANIRSQLEAGLSFRLGLNEQTLRWSRFPKARRLKPSNWFWRQKCDGRLQSCDYRRGGSKWPSRSIHDQTLITCFNSNASAARSLVFATGEVGGGQITRTDATMHAPHCPDCKRPRQPAPGATADAAILLRVAVLHHHPLPIAIPNKSIDGRTGEAKLEPFLVLKNGGDLIHELQRKRFDVILHGHKHRPQFARIELQADDPEDYPLLVLAGGSTAKRGEECSDNTLRDITTEPNGRLRIQTFDEGVLQEKNTYHEPLAVLKRRAFVRAIERAKISARQLSSEVVIDSVGHLRSLDLTSDLRVRQRGVTLDGMVSTVTLSAHDKRLDIQLEESCRDKVGMFWRDASHNRHELTEPDLPTDGYCWIGFNEPLKSDSQPLTFGVREGAANSIAMSQWELAERSRNKAGAADPDAGYEQVGYYISYPVEKLVLRLQLPAQLDGVTPEVRCRRHPDSPRFPLTFQPDQRRDAVPGRFVPDTQLMDEESKRLRYEAGQRSWVLEIDRPVAGNIYMLRWRVPNPIASATAIDHTRDLQDLLLKLADPKLPKAIGDTCRGLFTELAQLLMTRFQSTIDRDEQQTAFLMVYDAKDLLLRPVLTHVSGGSLPKGSYELPLGSGIGGAAFLQRRIVAWKNDPDSKSLIRPPSDNLDSRWILALPIYYQGRDSQGKPKLETQPGALIGVVTLGSNRRSSMISECYGKDDMDETDETAMQIGQEAQEFAQSYVFRMIDSLSRKPVS